MKKITAVIALLLIGTFILTACAGKNNGADASKNDPAIVGSWEESFYDSGYVFNEDGTGLDTFWNLSFTYTASDGVLKTTYDSELYGTAEYKYSISGSSLTMTRNEEGAETFTYEKQGASGRPAQPETASSTEAEAESETPAETE